MSKRGFGLAFACGLAAVGWVGAGFLGGHWVALAMTAAIAATYLLGAWELRQFRAASRALAAALAAIPQPLPALPDWLQQLPAPLRDAVRSRIEGGHGSLPQPVLTPYLVGLLVMLGMLGTFIGMVVTFRGAVFALEGSADLQAIRAALAAPIQGLGLAFGTSVAGVAASAMLGLMSVLARRERLEVARALEAQIATTLRPFSAAQRRRETFDALQVQAHVLPQVVERLDALMQRMEQRAHDLDGQLLERQARLQQETSEAYARLATALGATLKDGLAAGTTAAGENLQPVLAAAMAQVVEQARHLHERLDAVAHAQAERLAAHVAQATQHAQQLQERMEDRLARAQADQAAIERERLQAWLQAQEAAAADLRAGWQRMGDEAAAQHQATAAALAQAVQSAGTALEQAAEVAGTAVKSAGASAGAALERAVAAAGTAVASAAASAGSALQDASQAAGRAWADATQAAAASLANTAQAAGDRLVQATDALAGQATAQAGRTAGEVDRLLAASQDLVRGRAEAEARWTEQQGLRLDSVAATWREELAALREDESRRGAAAMDRLQALQDAVAANLATLGAALEAPLARLLQTAAEVPQSAAAVIAQLRGEMGRLAERENASLQERSELLQRLGALLESVNAASDTHRGAIEALTSSAAMVLEQAGTRFGKLLDAQATQAGEVAAQAGASAVELASLAQAFGRGVELYQASNAALADTLQRIEATLTRSTARSDEQLAYYVAQAREVIDLSIASQHGVIDQLRQLQAKQVAKDAAKASARDGDKEAARSVQPETEGAA